MAFIDALKALAASLRVMRDDKAAAVATSVVSPSWSARAAYESAATARCEAASERYASLAKDVAHHLWTEETVVMPAIEETLTADGAPPACYRLAPRPLSRDARQRCKRASVPS